MERGFSFHGLDREDDHWERLRPEEDLVDPLSGVIRELSMNASGFYIGGTTHISLGRLLGSELENKLRISPGPVLDPRDRKHSIEGTGETSPINCLQTSLFNDTFTDASANTTFSAYMKHVALEYPLLFSKKD